MNRIFTDRKLNASVARFAADSAALMEVERRNSLSDLNQLPALAFGHCNVTQGEAQLALGLLLLKSRN